MYETVVVSTVVMHFAFIAYVLAGGFLALRWRRTMWLHVPAVIWGIGIAAKRVDCPLTWVERWARTKAAMTPLSPDGFVAHYITGVIYPAGWVAAAQLVMFAIVAASWTLYLWLGQYAFPEQWSGNFLFYNKQLFDDAGVPPPPGSWERPWSFAEFLDAAQALTKQGRSGRDRQWGFVNAWVSFYAAGLFAMNNGVPWSVPRMNPTHLNFDHDGFLEAVQFYADLTNKHKVAPSAAEQQSMSTADLFSVGKAGIALAGHWRYQTFDRADGLDFDVAPLPIGPRGRAACSDIGVTGLAIAATSRRKDQAWEFVKFATGPVGQALIGESRLFVPVLRSAINSHGFANAHRRVGNLAVLSEGPAYSEGLPVTPAWEKIAALMDRYFGPVLRGSRPATSLTGLSQAVDEVLRNP